MIVLFVVCLVIITIIAIICWGVHISMVKCETSNWGWGSIKNFKKEFNKYTNWSNEDWGGHSLWDRKSNCKIHADIVLFNGIGMIMRTPIDYLLMHLFLRCKIKELKGGQLHYNWNKPSQTIDINFDWNKIDSMIAEWKAEKQK